MAWHHFALGEMGCHWMALALLGLGERWVRMNERRYGEPAFARWATAWHHFALGEMVEAAGVESPKRAAQICGRFR